MPEPDERLAPAPPEVPPDPDAEGIPTGWRALAPDLTPLRRHRDYRFLTVGQSVSFFGSMVTYVAVPYQVFRLTGSSLAVGLLGVVQMAALLALAFLGGALADAVDRRRLIICTQILMAATSAALAVNSMTSRPHVWPLYVITAVAAAISGIDYPARN
ncbi:MAG: MFS transporter, partial [Acidimicrobiia bacterium]